MLAVSTGSKVTLSRARAKRSVRKRRTEAESAETESRAMSSYDDDQVSVCASAPSTKNRMTAVTRSGRMPSATRTTESGTASPVSSIRRAREKKGTTSSPRSAAGDGVASGQDESAVGAGSRSPPHPPSRMHRVPRARIVPAGALDRRRLAGPLMLERVGPVAEARDLPILAEVPEVDLVLLADP